MYVHFCTVPCCWSAWMTVRSSVIAVRIAEPKRRLPYYSTHRRVILTISAASSKQLSTTSCWPPVRVVVVDARRSAGGRRGGMRMSRSLWKVDLGRHGDLRPDARRRMGDVVDAQVLVCLRPDGIGGTPRMTSPVEGSTHGWAEVAEVAAPAASTALKGKSAPPSRPSTGFISRAGSGGKS